MLRTLLFGVQPHDVATLAIACAVLGAAAAVAALLPAPCIADDAGGRTAQ
jgi:hypothetical protein